MKTLMTRIFYASSFVPLDDAKLGYTYHGGEQAADIGEGDDSVNAEQTLALFCNIYSAWILSWLQGRTAMRTQNYQT